MIENLWGGGGVKLGDGEPVGVGVKLGDGEPLRGVCVVKLGNGERRGVNSGNVIPRGISLKCYAIRGATFIVPCTP